MALHRSETFTHNQHPSAVSQHTRHDSNRHSGRRKLGLQTVLNKHLARKLFTQLVLAASLSWAVSLV